MSDDPSQQSLLKFPCTFAVKAVGKASDDFEQMVYEIVRRHVTGLTFHSVRSRSSSGGRYRSVTVTIIANDRQQLDAIYTDLTACEQVMMAL